MQATLRKKLPTPLETATRFEDLRTSLKAQLCALGITPAALVPYQSKEFPDVSPGIKSVHEKSEQIRAMRAQLEDAQNNAQLGVPPGPSAPVARPGPALDPIVSAIPGLGRLTPATIPPHAAATPPASGEDVHATFASLTNPREKNAYYKLHHAVLSKPNPELVAQLKANFEARNTSAKVAAPEVDAIFARFNSLKGREQTAYYKLHEVVLSLPQEKASAIFGKA